MSLLSGIIKDVTNSVKWELQSEARRAVKKGTTAAVNKVSGVVKENIAKKNESATESSEQTPVEDSDVHLSNDSRNIEVKAFTDDIAENPEAFFKSQADSLGLSEESLEALEKEMENNPTIMELQRKAENGEEISNIEYARALQEMKEPIMKLSMAGIDAGTMQVGTIAATLANVLEESGASNKASVFRNMANKTEEMLNMSDDERAAYYATHMKGGSGKVADDTLADNYVKMYDAVNNGKEAMVAEMSKVDETTKAQSIDILKKAANSGITAEELNSMGGDAEANAKAAETINKAMDSVSALFGNNEAAQNALGNIG